ncbi:MAG TPA: DUF6449 domain-containing protein [Anaerovoracaceae bacterium]|nr:DUF6449 domain-containing protein [Anaerovoracaceae bacterium]
MKLTKSFFSISPALIVENLKQYWAIAMVGFLLFFASGPFPVMMGVNNQAKDMYIKDILSNGNLMFIFVLVVLPVAASIAVFKYLHTTNAVTVIHSMPFSRQRLFNSAAISGMIIVVVPIILIGLIMALITGSDGFLWMVDSMIISLFVFSISTIAAVISGTIFVHTLLAFLLNYITNILIYFTQRYMISFLDGYEGSKFFDKVYSYLSPLSHRMNMSHIIEASEWWLMLIYVALSLAFLAIGYLLYKKVKLEHEGNGMVFKLAADVVSILIAFIGMTAIGYYLRSISDGGNDMIFFYFGCVIGSTVFFIVCRMIIERAVNIFSKENFIKYGIFVVIAAIFLSFTVFDITGYEKRVPEEDDVAYVTLPDLDNWAFYSDDEKYKAKFDDEESIEAVTQLHSRIVTEDLQTPYKYYVEPAYYAEEGKNEEIVGNVAFTYHLKNGKTMSRQYAIWFKPGVEEAIKSLYESDDNKSAGVFRGRTADDFKKIVIHDAGYYSALTLPASEEEGLMAAMDADFRARTYEQQMDSETVCFLNFDDYSESVRKSDKNAIRFLREHGYSDYLDSTFADRAMDQETKEKYGM